MKQLRAKIIEKGRYQFVLLPKSCQFPDGVKEVIVRREGAQIVLEPTENWPPEFLACLGSWNEPIPRPPQGTLSELAKRTRL